MSPGPWQNIPTRIADEDELSYFITGLRGSTDYEIEMAQESDFSDAVRESFTTLAQTDRSLRSVTINGVALANPNQASQNVNVNFTQATGTIRVVAVANNNSAVVSISPNNGIQANVKNGQTVVFTIGVRAGEITTNYIVRATGIGVPPGRAFSTSFRQTVQHLFADTTHVYASGITTVREGNRNFRKLMLNRWDLFSGSRDTSYSPAINIIGEAFGVIGNEIWLADGDQRVRAYGTNGSLVTPNKTITLPSGRNSDNRRIYTDIRDILIGVMNNRLMVGYLVNAVAGSSSTGPYGSLQIDCYNPSNGKLDGRNSFVYPYPTGTLRRARATAISFVSTNEIAVIFNAQATLLRSTLAGTSANTAVVNSLGSSVAWIYNTDKFYIGRGGNNNSNVIDVVTLT